MKLISMEQINKSLAGTSINTQKYLHLDRTNIHYPGKGVMYGAYLVFFGKKGGAQVKD